MSHTYVPLNWAEWEALLPKDLHHPAFPGSVWCTRCAMRVNTHACIRSAGRTGNPVLLCHLCRRVVWTLARQEKPVHPWKKTKGGM